MYHALSKEPRKDWDYLALTEDHFRSQMQAIEQTERFGLSLSELIAKGDHDGRGVVLTFDDGHISNIKIALPILREFGFTATFFVTTGRIGFNDEWLSWQDLHRLTDAGMDVQAHGHTHRFLDSLPESEQRQELERPLQMLKVHLGPGKRHFSFPGGRYSRYSLALARRLGYAGICTSEPGLNAVDGHYEGRTLKRYVVHQRTPHSGFLKCVTRDTPYGYRMAGGYLVKRLAKRALGNALYFRIWSALFEGNKS